MPEFTLQVGGEYRTRNGHKVTISVKSSPDVYRGSYPESPPGQYNSWVTKGRYGPGAYLVDHPLDIIGPWNEPTFPAERPRYFAGV